MRADVQTNIFVCHYCNKPAHKKRFCKEFAAKKKDMKKNADSKVSKANVAKD